MIIILEGADGTGKSTLAAEIAKQKGAHIIHSSFNKGWNIRRYHTKLIQHAKELEDLGIVVVMDRWAPSEQVYGDIFRDGPSYSVEDLIKQFNNNIKWIYCRNDKVIENHLRNLEKRHEMFDSMALIAARFEKYVQDTPELKWIVYDYDKNNMKEFVEEL